MNSAELRAVPLLLHKACSLPCCILKAVFVFNIENKSFTVSSWGYLAVGKDIAIKSTNEYNVKSLTFTRILTTCPRVSHIYLIRLLYTDPRPSHSCRTCNRQLHRVLHSPTLGRNRPQSIIVKHHWRLMTPLCEKNIQILSSPIMPPPGPVCGAPLLQQLHISERSRTDVVC